MSADPSDEPILLPILAIVVVTALLLVGVRSWLGPRHPDAPVGNPGVEQGSGPSQSFVFRPEAGRYVQEIRSSSGEQILVPFDIERRGSGITISRPWTPAEPDLLGAPPELRDRMEHIRVLVEVGPEGHVQDVTGPDDYFDRLDTTDPDLADRLRAMKLEEQSRRAQEKMKEGLERGKTCIECHKGVAHKLPASEEDIDEPMNKQLLLGHPLTYQRSSTAECMYKCSRATAWSGELHHADVL